MKVEKTVCDICGEYAFDPHRYLGCAFPAYLTAMSHCYFCVQNFGSKENTDETK